MTRVPTLASWCVALAILIAGISVASAQDIKGSIRHTSQAIVIDGNPDDAAWATANEYTLNGESFTAVGDMPDDDDDLSCTWKALWDDDNFYFYAVVTDDYFSNDGPDAWQDDSFELYLDADGLGKDDGPTVPDYNVDKEHPIYQLTIVPGEVEVTNGINHERWVTENGDVADLNAIAATSDTGYTIEWAIPWSTLTDFTPAEILERGFFGFGVAINDDDEAEGERQTQLSWATDSTEQWHDPTTFPDVELLFPEGPGPDIFVKQALDLGRVSAGVPVQFELEVGNVGQDNALTISSISVTGPDKDLVTVGELASVPASGVGKLAVTLDTVGRTGAFDFTIEIQSDDVDADDQTRTTRVNAAVINFTGPAAHYAMDDDAGGTELRDVTGYNRHGTLDGATLGGATLATGGSLNVSGGAQGVVPGEGLGEITDFTVSMWIQPSELAALQTVIGQGVSTPTFAVLVQDGDLNWFSGEAPEFGVAGAITAGTKYHVVASYTATQAVLYLDGVAVATQDDPVEVSIDPLDSYFIGAFDGGLAFSGLIDDVQIYDRVISADDVAELFTTPGTVLGAVEVPMETSNITWGDVDLDTTLGDLIGGSSITFAPFAYDGGNAEGTFWTGDGGTTGDDILDSVYNSHGWNGDGASITLDGLTAGESYQVQLLGAGDTRGCCNTRNQAASDGTNVSSDFPRGNSSVIGSFTATGATQDIMIVSGTDNGVDPGLSGFILTDAAGSFISASNVGRTEGDDITLTVPTGGDGPLDLLVLGADDTGETGADANVLAFLGETFGAENVRYQNSGATDGTEAADVIIFSSTFGSGSVRGKFHNAAVPIVNWEEAVMDASAEGEFGQSSVIMTKSTDTVQMALSDHPIAGDLAGTTIDFFSAPGAETLGSSSLSAGTEAVGTAADGSIVDLAMLFATEAGAAVADGAGVTDNVSPARRVAFPITDSSFNDLTDAGKQLFVNSIRWAAGVGGDPSPNLVGYWPADEGEGTTVADVSGNGLDGTLVGGTWGAGASGGGFEVIGEDGGGSYVEVPATGKTFEQITITGWINGAHTGDWSGLIQARGGEAPDQPIGIGFSGGSGNIGYTWNDNSNTSWGFESGVAIPPNEWVFIALSLTEDEATLYVGSGGELNSAVNAVPQLAQMNMNTSWFFGKDNCCGTARNFDGLMDDISIWDVALSESDLLDLFNGAETPLTLQPEVMPTPTNLILEDVGITENGVFGLTIPDGFTVDIEYSTDLENWEVIAPGLGGALEETDADRIAAPAGFYRAKQ